MNLTATLAPANAGEHDFVLDTKRRGFRYAGDYLVWIDDASKEMTVLRMRFFKERILVYVDETEQLKTDHTFWFLGIPFLKLHYTMKRKEEAVVRERSSRTTPVASDARW
jgi:hypothetical protein